MRREAGLATVAQIAERAPRFAGWSLAAARSMLDGPVEVAIIGRAGEERTRSSRSPAATPTLSSSWPTSPSDDNCCWSAGTRSTAARRRNTVCRNLVCERPVTSPESSAKLVR